VYFAGILVKMVFAAVTIFSFFPPPPPLFLKANKTMFLQICESVGGGKKT